MKHRVSGIFLAFCAGIMLLSVNVFAASNEKYSASAEMNSRNFSFGTEVDVTAAGTCGERLNWELRSDGVLLISGAGPMTDFTESYLAPWMPWGEQITSLIVEGSTGQIGDYAFSGCKNLSTIEIREGVTSIGDRAFYACEKLGSAVLPDSVTHIGNRAFSWCDRLSQVVLPKQITGILSGTFENCSSLVSAAIPAGVTSIGDAAFSGCSSLREVVLPDTLISIGNSAFACCGSLGELKLPETLQSIGNFAFTWCSSLQEIVLPKHVQSVGEHAFSVCEKLRTVQIPDSVITIGHGAFHDCDSLLQIEVDSANAAYCSIDGVLFTKDLDTLAAFPGGRGGTYVVPEGVTRIEEVSFAACTGLECVILPEGVAYIGLEAFRGCGALKNVVLPGSVTRIRQDAFNYCGLEKLFYTGTRDQWAQIAIDTDNDPLLLAERVLISSRADLRQITAAAALRGGRIAIAGGELCAVGERVQVIAIPEPGYRLKAVLVDGKPVEGTEFIVSDHHAVSAQFEAYRPEMQIRDSGSCGTYLTWTLYADGQLLVSGTGPMDYDYTEGVPWFYDCLNIKTVLIDAGVDTVAEDAFMDCWNLTTFEVAENNAYYCTDRYGVLYTKNMDMIVQYPAGNARSCYNVREGTELLGETAFFDCSNLQDLYIPRSVKIDEYADIFIDYSITVCAYSDSDAYQYAMDCGNSCYAMEKFELMQINVQGIPESGVLEQSDDGSVDLSALYVTQIGADGLELQLDDYAVAFSGETGGIQTMTVTYQGKSFSAEVLCQDLQEEVLLSVEGIHVPQGGQVPIVVYDAYGKMVSLEKALVRHGTARAVISKEDYEKMAAGRAFTLDSSGRPADEAKQITA